MRIFFLLMFVFPSLIFAKDRNYNVEGIPANLTRNASTVIRYKGINFEIKNEKKATKHVEYAITILNKNGIDKAYFVQVYNEFSKIKSIKATVYDEKGNKVKRLRKTDIGDYSAISGYSLYEDSRVKYLDPEYRIFPFTVEYSFEVEYNGLLNFPHWRPFQGINTGVELSEFEVSCPVEYNFRYYEENIDKSVKIKEEKGKRIFYWSIENFQPVLKEDFYSSDYDCLPQVYTAPSDFSIDGYEGNMESWKALGLWVNDLLKGKSELDDQTQEHIKELVSGAKSDKEKVRILYSYLQETTRYVSIQAGIGGWQPFEAQVVQDYSYGDCKALTNYMRSILKVVGIESYYTLVKAGRNKPGIIREFPSNQFNHAILFVPLLDDSIWLECTNQKIPFNYLGTFTDDRDVLVITKDGGKILHTPEYAEEENVRTLNAVHELRGRDVKSEIRIECRGLFYEQMLPIKNLENQKRIRLLSNKLEIPSFEILNYHKMAERIGEPVFNVNIELEIPGYSTLLGNRLVVPLHPLGKTLKVPAMIKKRRSDIYVNRSYRTIDTILYKIPDEYNISKLPEKLDIQSKFGKFNLEFIMGDEGLFFTRKLHISKGVYPPDNYDEFITFLEELRNSSEMKFILEKK